MWPLCIFNPGGRPLASAGWWRDPPRAVFSSALESFHSSSRENRKGCRRQAHAVSDNPPSTAGTHRHHPTKIIQRKHSLSGLFPLFPPCISLFKDWAFQSCVILALSASLLFSFLMIVFLSRVFPLLSFPPHHRCCGSSHHNPVSCPLNNSQVHTPCSCRDYTPTQTRSHGPVRAHRAPSKMRTGIFYLSIRENNYFPVSREVSHQKKLQGQR